MKNFIYFIISFFSISITFSQTVSTFAGYPSATGVFCGTTDGTGTASRFCVPNGIAIDASGNIFIADTNNHTIRKITPAGVVSTFAGEAGVIGNINTTNILFPAQFYNPNGVAVDNSGNVFVADTNNNKIRKITPAGWVSTFAGSGTAGSTDGVGTTAKFNSPTDIAVDASGNVYVADKNNHTIRKITPSSVVTTLAGTPGIFGSADGLGSNAGFYFPSGIAVDSNGNIYVADTSNSTIRKITSSGLVSTIAGSAGLQGSTNGLGSLARFRLPTGLTVDASGDIFVTDTFNHTIRKITLSGIVSTLIGSTGTSGSTDGNSTLARFFAPQGIVIDNFGNMFIADTNNSRIRKITGIPLGNTNFEFQFNIKLYPNPATSLLYIQSLNNSILDKVCIFDLTGKKILEQTKNTNQIDVSNFIKGMYLIEIFSGEDKIVNKLILK